MTKIDWSARVTIAEQNAAAMAAHAEAVKAECALRISAVASIPTQVNLAAHVPTLTAYEKDAYLEFLVWIEDMRTFYKTVSEDLNIDPAAAAWPVPSEHVLSLLEQY